MKNMRFPSPSGTHELYHRDPISGSGYQQQVAKGLKELKEQGSKPWRKFCNLRLIGKETRTSQKGNEYHVMIYQTKEADSSNWEDRRTPIYTDEAKFILEAIDYNEESVYLITYEKDNNGYTNIIDIARIDEEDTNVSADANGELV